MNTYAVDYGFTEMLNIRVIQGRSFARNYNDDESALINEKAAR